MSGSATFSVPPISNQWELLSQNLSFGDGTSASLGTQSVTWSHMYPAAGTYQATLTDTDLLGRTSKASVTAVSADEYQMPYNVPVRDYDSRTPAISWPPTRCSACRSRR